MQALMETELTRRILRSVPILAHLTEGDRDKVPRLRRKQPTRPNPVLSSLSLCPLLPSRSPW